MADDIVDPEDQFRLSEEDTALDDNPALAKIVVNLADNVAALTNSMQAMGESITEIRQRTSTTTAKRDSRAVDVMAEGMSKRQCITVDNDDGDAAVEALLARPDNDKQPDDTECEEDEFLKVLASEYMSEDATSTPVSSQLAAILDKSWSTALSDAKLKEKLAKYNRPENCGRLLAPKVNPEIWSRISNLGQKQDLKFVSVQKALASAGSALAKSTQQLLDHRQSTENDIERKEILASQIDALALLGHANYQLSLRRRDVLKLFLKKDYASLCSSQTAVSSLLFGDELQTQLSAIRASNRISNTAVGLNHRTANTSGVQSSRSWRSKNNDRNRHFFYKSPNPRWTSKSTASPQNPRRGANKK